MVKCLLWVLFLMIGMIVGNLWGVTFPMTIMLAVAGGIILFLLGYAFGKGGKSSSEE